MPAIAYENKRLSADRLVIVAQANELLASYAEQGLDVTLRQLYYRFVALDLFPDDRTWTQVGRRWVRDPEGTKNADPNYKWLGDIVSIARMTGRLDWGLIVDRTRELDELPHWDSPTELVEAAAGQFRVDRWATQPVYVEVWIEKDALEGVIERPCRKFDVPFFSCRGYTGQAAMWEAGQRLLGKIRDGKRVVILHMGDHDPSGIDMTRDIEDRLWNFVAQDYLRGRADDERIDVSALSEVNRELTLKPWVDEVAERLTVDRIALSMEQVERYAPPPNPAKVTDSRFRSYRVEYGDESWELDALDPAVLAELVESSVGGLIEDPVAWERSREEQQEGRARLAAVGERWDEVVAALDGRRVADPEAAVRAGIRAAATFKGDAWAKDELDEAVRSAMEELSADV